MTVEAHAPKQVLVGDDSRFFRSLMSFALDQEGYVGLVAESGEQVFQVLAQEPDVELLVLDLMMPGISGFQVVERLRADAKYERLEVLVISQHGINSLEREILKKHGVRAILTKSTSIERILFEVRNALFPAEREARKSVRVPLSMAVTARTGRATHLTTTFNLSEHGMFLVLADRAAPEVDEELQLKFWVPNAESLFQARAKVAWVNSPTGPTGLRRSHPPGFAVEFIEPAEDVQEAIRVFIRAAH